MYRRRFIQTMAGAAGAMLAAGESAITAAATTATASATAPAPEKHFDIVYPQIRPDRRVHEAFALATLEVAMKAANATYTAHPLHMSMERGRALAELATGKTINLHWTSMEAQAERGLKVVHIPIHRGLIGYRVFLIRQDRQADFDRVETLDDLRKLTGVQGLGWIDANIMRNAGLPVQTTSTYETLFKMVDAGRVDYFPRGVIEVFPEFDERRSLEPDLAVEQRLILAYRSDFIFYVSPAYAELADTIARGFAAAYQDGSYMALFNSHPYIQTALQRANFNQRRILHIDNPYLSDEDRAIPDTYWVNL